MNDYNLPAGEIDLIADEKKCISIDAFTGDDEWKADYLELIDEGPEYNNSGLQAIDLIWEEWLDNLSFAQLRIIDSTNSLTGIPVPKNWILVWRHILKFPKLRDVESAARNGMGLNSFAFYWCLWAEESMKKYLTPMEQEIVALNDAGVLREEIGIQMLNKYGDEFWKPRKKDTKTTPMQVVNNYFYTTMPTHIAKQELIDIAKAEYQTRKKWKK